VVGAVVTAAVVVVVAVVTGADVVGAPEVSGGNVTADDAPSSPHPANAKASPTAATAAKYLQDRLARIAPRYATDAAAPVMRVVADLARSMTSLSDERRSRRALRR
jgi:hypothetical protein